MKTDGLPRAFLPALALIVGLTAGLTYGCDDPGNGPADAGPRQDVGPRPDAGPRPDSGGGVDAGPPAPIVEPEDPGAGDVRLTIDSTEDVHPISPWIYGHNQPDWGTQAGVVTLERAGGNRWTAYNWENNASNAGSDYFHQNDSYLGGGDAPGGAIRARVEPAHGAGAAALITVPIAGYVSADKDGGGDVAGTPDYLNRRFHRSMARGSSGSTPDTSDAVVYQDQLVRWAQAELAPSGPVFYSLDNEPDLWDYTHERIRESRLTYAELISRTIEYAGGIRAEAPEGMIFGPVHYGFQGMINLQDAPDAAGEEFVERYLRELRAASDAGGARLVDVLDIHWYPEARGDGQRVTDDGASAGLAEARMQAPRSLWDPSYTEESWIIDVTGGPIALIPWLQEKIDRLWPGTRLAITEYYYGGGDHISGGIAQAAVLGVFGREDLFAACLWHLGGTDDAFIDAAFRIYRDAGDGVRFGDLSGRATTDDDARSAVFVSTDSGRPGELAVVVINRSGAELDARLSLRHRGELTAGTARTLGASSSAIGAGPTVEAVGRNAFRFAAPAHSVSILRFTP